MGKAHIDLTLQGMRNTVRFARKDIAEWAQDILEAEDAGRPTSRYAIYSVWVSVRPTTSIVYLIAWLNLLEAATTYS